MSHQLFKRTLGVTLAAGLMLGSTACNRGGDDGGGGAGEDVSLTLAVSTLNNPFFISLRDGAQEAADEAGVDLEVVDAQNDATSQQNQLTNAATQDVDGVILNPVDSEAAAAAVTPVQDADIPVVAVDRGVEGAEVASTVSSDNVGGGEQAAEVLAEAVGEQGQVITLQGVPGTSASRDRGAGFEEGIGNFPDIEVAATQPANFDRTEGLNVATNLLQSNPDVGGIFAENDEMAMGAIEALGNRAGEVPVVGFDGTDDALQAVQDGTMHATIAQQPDELGRVGVEQALAVIDGEEVEPETSIEVVTVTEDNVGEFVQ